MSDRNKRDVCDDENMEKNEAGECVCIGETSEDGECQVKSDRKRRDACEDENMEKNEVSPMHTHSPASFFSMFSSSQASLLLRSLIHSPSSEVSPMHTHSPASFFSMFSSSQTSLL